MSLLNTVSAGTNNLAAGTGALSLVSTTSALIKNQGIKGIQGFVFDIPLENAVTLHASITDHYVEENYAIQDHISLEPLRIRASGRVGELTFTKDQLTVYLNTVLAMLAPISYSKGGVQHNLLDPSIEQKAQQILAQYTRTKQAVLQALSTAQQAAASIPGVGEALGIDGSAPSTAQGKAFKVFYDWFNMRSQIPTQVPNGSLSGYAANLIGLNGVLGLSNLAQGSGWSLLTVETPWRSFENMALESVEFSQDETTLLETTITVELKQIRVASVAAAIGELQPQGWAQAAAPVQNQGTAKTTTVDSSGPAQVWDAF